MIKYLDKKTLKVYLLKALSKSNVTDENQKFLISPIIERGKSLNSTDDYIHRTILNNANLKERVLDIDSVVEVLGCMLPLAPLWVNIHIQNSHSGETMIELQCSLRFRLPSILQNQDTGHPPFRVLD